MTRSPLIAMLPVANGIVLASRKRKSDPNPGVPASSRRLFPVSVVDQARLSPDRPPAKLHRPAPEQPPRLVFGDRLPPVTRLRIESVAKRVHSQPGFSPAQPSANSGSQLWTRAKLPGCLRLEWHVPD